MKRIIILAAMIFAALATIALPSASASPTPELCVGVVNGLTINPAAPCADAYNNGGGLIKSYQPGATWEDIQMYSLGNGLWELYDVNTGLCLGDDGNNQYTAKLGDSDLCPLGGSAGWGTIFSFYSEPGCASNTGALYDNHWKGYITGYVTNGSQWYLNGGSGLCLYPFGSPGF